MAPVYIGDILIIYNQPVLLTLVPARLLEPIPTLIAHNDLTARGCKRSPMVLGQAHDLLKHGEMVQKTK